MILMIDNYDSFVFNLSRYFRELGEEVCVRRHDEISIDQMKAMQPDHIVISPGPGTPLDSGVSLDVLRSFSRDIPILGVCLGHQCIAHVFGGRVIRAEKPIHGKTSTIIHQQKGIFQGIPSPFQAMRYHSLIIERSSLPPDLIITAESGSGEIMGISHRDFPLVGIQFHPESILTDHGHSLLDHFLKGNYR